MKSVLWISLLICSTCAGLDAQTQVAAKKSASQTLSSEWQLGVSGWGLHRFTLFEAIEKVQALGLSAYDGLSFQKVSSEISMHFDASLPPEDLERIIAKLAQHGVTIPVFYYAKMPQDEAGCRKVFDFGRRLGIKTFVSEPAVESLDLLEEFCERYEINLALHNHGPKQSPHYWSPSKVLEHCRGRSRRIGVCPDTGYWIRAGVDPVKGIRQIGDRLITIQLHDLNEKSPAGHDVPWGRGIGEVDQVFSELLRLQLDPTLIGLEYSYDFEDNLPEMRSSIAYFKQCIEKMRKTD